MRIGYAWLIAGVTFLASQSSLLAQGVPPDAAPGNGVPAAGGSLPGVQGAFTPPPPIRPGQPISVLVFPFGFGGAMEAAPAAPAEPANPGEAPAAGAEGATGGGSALSPEQQEVVNYLTAAVKAGFLSTPAYSVASYHPQSALIQRARKDEILRPEHIQDMVSATGAVDVEKARAIAYRLGMQSVLVGTIDMSTDPATRNVEITLEAQLVDSATGKPLKTAAVGGAAAGAEGVPVIAIQERAAQEAAQRMLPAMGIQLVLPRRNENSSSPAAPRVRSGKQTPAERKAAQAAAKAEREAAEKAREAAKAAEKQRKKDEEAAKKAGKASGSSSGKSTPKVEADTAPAATIQPAALQAQPAAQPPAAPAQPAAQPAPPAAPAMGNTAGTVQGVADEAGRPIPYGYAVSKQDSGLPRRERSGLRVPPWLGLVGFLTGVSFLL